MVHDESNFYSNDSSPIIWVQDRDPDVIRPKSNGRSVMVSGFACSCCGFVSLGEQKSNKIIKPGKGGDGWWTCSDLVSQFDAVIPLFKATHPDSDLLFLFDNSSNHHAKNPSTPDAYQLNLGDGGKSSAKIRDTTYNGGCFHMQVNGEVMSDASIQKGVKTILLERGDYRATAVDGSKINLTCAHCKVHRSRYPTKEYCCHQGRLSQHSYFVDQLEWIEETATNRENVEVKFFPKFHCELNFIERVWACVKQILRKKCTYSFSALRARVPIVLDSIPSGFVRKIAQSCFRWMDGYRYGLAGALLQYAMKKYAGHRTIRQALDKEFDDQERLKLNDDFKESCRQKIMLK